MANKLMQKIREIIQLIFVQVGFCTREREQTHPTHWQNFHMYAEQRKALSTLLNPSRKATRTYVPAQRGQPKLTKKGLAYWHKSHPVKKGND